MRLLLLAAAALAFAAAKPETYKEKEDFQFSRSSSDDGTKSGYYGAQRGNMGGNYERAHNMDSLAQNQMSGLVKQVEGELGDGTKTRTGSVYSAANSRGVYGSGHYDLSNLAGRNFQEGVTYGNSESHSSSMNSAYQHQSSSASKSAYDNNQYHSSGRSGGYQAAGYTGQIQSTNLQAQASHNENRGSEYNYGQRADQSTGYYSQSGNHGQSAYDNTNYASSSDYGSNAHSRLISANPMRVVVRPGTSVTIPVAAQTYDDSLHTVSSNGQNSVNSEAEVLGNTDYQTIYQVTTKPKHYESSYRYHKQWEKHDTIPVGEPLAVPTSNSLPKNSELYEDTQAHKTDSQFEAIGLGSLNSQSSNGYSGHNANSAASSNTQSRNRYSGYNANSAASSQSQYQTDYNSQLHGLSSGSNSNSANGYNTYNSARSTDSLNQIVGDLNSKPKSYQSSYAYHKSWERQGDPYVITPVSGGGVYTGEGSQKLTAASSNQGAYASHQYGSNYQQSQQRYKNNALDCDENGHIRVARSYDTQQANYNEYQQSQNIYEELSQQTQNLEDLGQQTQNLEDLSQQTQNLEDFGQQTQTQLDNLEDLGQQTQTKWDKLEDAEQQSLNKWDKLEDLGQQTQTQNKWDNLEDIGQQPQKELGQQTQDTGNNFDIRPQENDGQQTQTNWDNLSESNQQIQSTQDRGQVSQTVTHIEPENVHSFDHAETVIKPDTHQVQTIWDKIGSLDQSHNNNENRNMQEDTQLDQNNWQQVYHNVDSNNKNFKNDQIDKLGITENYNIKPVWEQNADDTQQYKNTDLEFNPNRMPQVPVNNVENVRPQGQSGYLNGFNTQTDNFSQNSNMSVFSTPNLPSSSSLDSLWDKFDNIFKESTTNDTKNTNSNNFVFNSTNSQHSYQNFGHAESYNYNSESDQHSYNNSEQAQMYHYNNNFNSSQVYQNNQLGSHYIGYQSSQPNVPNANKTSTEKPIKENKLRPQDIGRGDIGPEDSSSNEIPIEKVDNMFEFNTSPEIKPAYHDNKYKSPEEIDSLSLTKENNNSQSNNLPSDTELSILSLNQQKWLEDQKQHSENSFSYSTSTTTTTITPKSHEDDTFINNQHFPKLIGNHQFISEKENLSKSEESSAYDKFNTISTHLDQGPEEIYKHNIHQKVVNTEQNEYRPGNFEQQYADLGQQNDKLNKNDNQQYGDLGQENDKLYKHDDQQYGQQHQDELIQQNMEQQFESFGQHPKQQNQEKNYKLFDNFGQQHEHQNQQNVGQQFDGFRQDIEQQNMGQQLEGFGQQLEQQNQQKTDQLFESFGQTDEQLNQQNMGQKFDGFGQQHEQQNQQNLEQQFESFGQENDKLDQENTQHQFVDFGQQNVEQKLVDLGQQVQTPRNENKILKPQSNIQRSDSVGLTPIHEDNVVPLHIAHSKHSLKDLPTDTNIKPKVDIESPQEDVTENPGFWKSVGNKFSGAKDKVFSWFKKS